MTAFDRAWGVAKVDFALGPMPRSRRSDSLGTSWHTPRTYKYRVPTGKDAEGKLIYGPREHEVSDRSFINLPKANKRRGLNEPKEGAVPGFTTITAEDWGPWRRPPVPGDPITLDNWTGSQNLHEVSPQESYVSGRGIIDTIVHESMHDADPFARFLSESTGRASFGARPSGFRNTNPVSDKGEFHGLPKEGSASMTRAGHGLGAETMAYLGEYSEAPGKANLATMRHSDVDKVDVKWMLNRLVDARKRAGIAENTGDLSHLGGRFGVRFADNPEQILSLSGGRIPDYIKQPKNARGIIGTHALDTPETANFTVPKSQQIRRNMINAVNEMAMTRMHESGEFLEDTATSQERYETTRSRPSAARRKAVNRETSPARRAINAHWKKVEAGKAPVPNSMEDLPENVQRLIGQQQIRSVLGLQRGRASEPIMGLDPADALEEKLRGKMGRSLTYSGDDAQREKWDKLPFEEREVHLREYLTELSGMMTTDLSRDRYWEPKYDHEWGDDIFDVINETKWERRCREHDSGPHFHGYLEHSDEYQRKCTGDMKNTDESETGCDGYSEPKGKEYADLLSEFAFKFGEEPPYDGAEDPGKFAYRGVSPGKKHRIVPHRYTPPSGIPAQDWLEMLQWASGKRQPIQGRSINEETWFGHRKA